MLDNEGNRFFFLWMEGEKIRSFFAGYMALFCMDSAFAKDLCLFAMERDNGYLDGFLAKRKDAQEPVELKTFCLKKSFCL
jgi:hypothetical protein